MASSTPPYSINTSKPLQTPNPNLKNHIHNQQKRPHKFLYSHCSASPANGKILTPPSSTSLRSHCPSLLGPEFQRNRTTKIVCKRNLSSQTPGFSQAHSASAAVADVTAQLLCSSSDDLRDIGGILGSFKHMLRIPEDYCFVFRELGNKDKCPQKALLFFQSSVPLMRNSTEKGKLLTAAIAVLGKMGRHDLARQVFEFGLARGFGNTVYAYSALISAYARNGMASKAISVLSLMKASGVRPNTISYNAVIDACGKGGVDLEVTLGFYREMLQNGIFPDRKTFNSLLAGCSLAGRFEDAQILFNEMLELGISRDIYTYNIFIDVICKSGHMELAAKCISEMLTHNVQPNVVTYSTLMDGYAKLDCHEEALNLYSEMKLLGIQLDRICYNTLLSIYTKCGMYEEITSVCEEIEILGIEKDIVTYNSLISGYGKQGRFDTVSYLIQDMREKGISLNILSYSTLIDVYSKAGMFEDAANVFLDFKESGLRADVVLYSSFIDMLAKNGLVKCAVKLFDEMTQIGIEPNVVTYNAIIDGFGKSRLFVERGIGNGMMGGEGDCNQIDRIIRKLTKKMGEPMMEEALRKSEELVCILGLFQRMVRQRVRPNVVTFSAILNACSRCDSFEDASLLLKQLRLFDGFVYGVAFGLLMGCRDAWLQAQALFDEVRCLDNATSSALYNALTDMLWHYGQRRGAQQVVLEGVRQQVWENTWNEFTLDLHLMSSGAAQAMVHAWLLSLSTIVSMGQKLPEAVSILTGWGKHSKVTGASPLRHVVETLLNSIGAPFHMERFNVGRFVSPGTIAAAWLRKAGTATALILHDERSQPFSSLALLPSMEALQL